MERRYVGIDLHRRRSVIYTMTAEGEKASCVRIANDPVALSLAVAPPSRHASRVQSGDYCFDLRHGHGHDAVTSVVRVAEHVQPAAFCGLPHDSSRARRRPGAGEEALVAGLHCVEVAHSSRHRVACGLDLVYDRLQVVGLTHLVDPPVRVNLERGHDLCGGIDFPPSVKPPCHSTMTVVPSATSASTTTVWSRPTASCLVSSSKITFAPRRTPCGPSTQTASSFKNHGVHRPSGRSTLRETCVPPTQVNRSLEPPSQ